MAMNIKFEGAQALNNALLELSTKEAQKVGRFALRKAARAILNAAKANVPVDQGRLRKALQIKVDRGRERKDMIFASVRVKKGPTYRPRKTNRKSRIKGKLQDARYNYQIGSTPEVYGAFLEFGRHNQGIAAHPWMRPAWDAEGGQVALTRIGQELGAGIEAAAARLRGHGFGGR